MATKRVEEWEALYCKLDREIEDAIASLPEKGYAAHILREKHKKHRETWEKAQPARDAAK